MGVSINESSVFCGYEEDNNNKTETEKKKKKKKKKENDDENHHQISFPRANTTTTRKRTDAGGSSCLCRRVSLCTGDVGFERVNDLVKTRRPIAVAAAYRRRSDDNNVLERGRRSAWAELSLTRCLLRERSRCHSR